MEIIDFQSRRFNHARPRIDPCATQPPCRKEGSENISTHSCKCMPFIFWEAGRSTIHSKVEYCEYIHSDPSVEGKHHYKKQIVYWVTPRLGL